MAYFKLFKNFYGGAAGNSLTPHYHRLKVNLIFSSYQPIIRHDYEVKKVNITIAVEVACRTNIESCDDVVLRLDPWIVAGEIGTSELVNSQRRYTDLEPADSTRTDSTFIDSQKVVVSLIFKEGCLAKET